MKVVYMRFSKRRTLTMGNRVVAEVITRITIPIIQTS